MRLSTFFDQVSQEKTVSGNLKYVWGSVEWRVKMTQWEGTLVPLLWQHSNRSKSQPASPSSGPRGQDVVNGKNSNVSLSGCVCVFTCTRIWEGRGRGAYINHKLSGSGSCTSNEMVQIKVCLWVVCVWQCCLGGNSWGSVPDLNACSISGSTTRAF